MKGHVGTVTWKNIAVGQGHETPEGADELLCPGAQ